MTDDAQCETWKLWILGGVFFCAALLSVTCLTQNPPSWFDEGIYHQITKNLARDQIAGLSLSPSRSTDLSMISVGYPVFFPAALVLRIFGDGIVTLRLAAVAFLFGFLALFYLLARRVYGTRSALFSVAVLATFSPLYGHGKNFLGEVPGLFYLVSGLYLLTRWEDSPRSSLAWSFAAGLALGLAAASKPTFLVILPAVAIGLIWNWRRFFSDRRSRAASATLIFGGALALLAWIGTQFGGAWSPSRVLAHYSNPYYIKNFAPLVLRNLQRFVTETTPAHFFVLLLVAGCFLGKKIRERKNLRFAEITIAIFILLTLAFYLRTVGWYRYFFPAHALLFLFLPQGMMMLCKERRVLHISFFLIACIHFIPLVQERLRCVQDAPSALEPILASLPRDEPVLFYSLPQLAARYRGSAMYQYIRMSDLLALGEENVRLAQSGFFSRIFMEERLRLSLPNCYETEKVIHGIHIVRKNPRISCRV